MFLLSHCFVFVLAASVCVGRMKRVIRAKLLRDAAN
jgi:hypothetical protein